MTIHYNRPKLTGYQKAIIDSPARFTITEAATKTGKTTSHIVWLFEQALHGKKGYNYWWVAPVFSQAEIAYKRMKRYASESDFFIANESKLTLTLPHGSVIHFKSAEKPDNLYGEDVYACVFDEFTRAREEAWFALRTTLTATNGKCKMIGNVKGKKNWGYKLGMRAKSGESGYEYHKITAHDAVKAGILSDHEVHQAQRDLPEAVFRELYLAEALDDAANPFGIDNIRKCVFPLNGVPEYFGVDLAKSHDWTVIVGITGEGVVAFFDRFQSDWLQTRRRIIEVTGRSKTMIDSTGVGDPIVEDLQRENHNITSFKFTQDSKQRIMEGLAYAIQRGLITILPGVMQDELESFEFEYTRTGVRYTAPSGLHDDCVCALALAYYQKEMKPRQRLMATRLNDN